MARTVQTTPSRKQPKRTSKEPQPPKMTPKAPRKPRKPRAAPRAGQPISIHAAIEDEEATRAGGRTLEAYKERVAFLERASGKSFTALVSDPEALDVWMRAKYPNPGTRASTIASLHAAAKGLKMRDEANRIKAYMMTYSDDYKQIRQRNEPNPKLAAVGLEVFPWSEFRDKVEKMTTFDADHALLAMYTMLPVRRLEFRHLVYYDKAPLTPDPTEARPRVSKVNVDKERHDPTTGVAWNYIYKKADGGMRMVLRTYKTSTNLGVYAVDLPPELVDVLDKYLGKAGKGDGDFLFTMARKKNQPFSQSNFTQHVQKTVKKYSGINVNIGIRELRSGRVTANRDEEDPNYLEKEALAAAMGHGVNTAEASYVIRTSRGRGNRAAQAPPQDQAGPSAPPQAQAGPSAPPATPRAPPADLRSYESLLEEIAFLKSRLEDVEGMVRRMMSGR